MSTCIISEIQNVWIEHFQQWAFIQVCEVLWSVCWIYSKYKRESSKKVWTIFSNKAKHHKIISAICYLVLHNSLKAKRLYFGISYKQRGARNVKSSRSLVFFLYTSPCAGLRRESCMAVIWRSDCVHFVEDLSHSEIMWYCYMHTNKGVLQLTISSLVLLRQGSFFFVFFLFFTFPFFTSFFLFNLFFFFLFHFSGVCIPSAESGGLQYIL